jgi:predicted transcriptional regulator
MFLFFDNKDSEFIIDLSILNENYGKRQTRVRKSKLETYEDMLEVLLNKPLTSEDISKRAISDNTLLKQHLDFLMKNGLIEERTSERKTSYAVTERGVAVLRALNFQKYLGKIKNKLRAIDEAMQVIPEISDRSHSFGKESKD